ncbi:MAG: sigma-70 family RNA polymerase sigma factor [Planctomycetota bacterium]
MINEPDILNAAVARVLAGDKDAYAEIVSAFQDMLLAFAAFRVADGDMADEVVQQTFIRAYEQLDKYQQDKDFGQWLRTICKFMIMAELKRCSSDSYNRRNYGDHIRGVLSQAALETFDEHESSDTAKLLEACMKNLPERSQAVLNMRYEQKLPASTIGDRFGQSEGWVATVLFRLRGELKKCIEQRMKAASA